MNITKQQIEHIAELARLGITEQEKEKYVSDLGRILDYFKKLEQVDTSQIQPIKQITGLHNTIRQDESIINTEQEKILTNAPARKNKFIKVKSVL